MRASGIDITSIDHAVRPQDDFFGHANGAWLRNAVIPEDRSRMGGLISMGDAVHQDVQQLLSDLQEGFPADIPRWEGDEHARALVVGIVAGYLKTERRDELGATPIADLMHGVRAAPTRDELWRVWGELARVGVPSPVSLIVTGNPHRPEDYTVLLMQGGLGLPDEAYYREAKHEKIRDEYLGHLERLGSLGGIDDPAAFARSVFDVETRLASHHLDNVEVRDADKANKTVDTLPQLRERAPHIPWDQWFSGMQAPVERIDTIGVLQPSFLTGLNALTAEISLADWQNWSQWRILTTFAPYLSSEFELEQFAFRGKAVMGVPQQLPAQRRALDLVSDLVPDALSQFYVARHFTPAAKQRMDELVANLVAAFRVRLQDLPWMTPATRAKALEKLEAFTPKIGYPSVWKTYDTVTCDPDDLLGAIRSAHTYAFARKMDKIGAPVDRTEWLMPAHMVNAYYMSTRNEIVFPAGILRTPMFDLEADDAVNYGAIGAVIGHEMGHGFDDQGSKYDGTGRYNNWWMDEDRAAFEVLSDRLIAQFDGHFPRQLPELRLNGAMTVGENIGDLTGLSIGHLAYRLSLKGQEAPVIDGLTGDQRFFFGWAQGWKVKYRDEHMKFMVASDVHAPAEHRVNIAGNLTEFYEAFDVREGDGMWLPEEQRVRIW